MNNPVITPPPDRYLQVNGIDTRYWQMGNSGSVIVLLHGGNGSIEFWLYNIATLAQHHQVYAFDMVGAGKSDCPDRDYALVDQAHFLHDLMAELNLATATLIGNSMGGGVALEFTRLYPDRVDRLALVGSMGFGPEINLGIRLITLPAVALLLRPGRWMIPAMLRSNFYDGTSLPPEWIEFRYPIFALPGRNHVILKLGQNNFNLAGVIPEVYQPIFASLPDMRQKTLIVWGDCDRIIPVKHAYIAAERIPNSQLQVFPNCGHHPYLEYPAKFNRLVLDFLAS